MEVARPQVEDATARFYASRWQRVPGGRARDLVLDMGAQYAQLIARRVGEAHVGWTRSVGAAPPVQCPPGGLGDLLVRMACADAGQDLGGGAPGYTPPRAEQVDDL